MNTQTTLSEKGQVVIPKDVRDALGFVAGQKLDVIRSGNGVFLRPAQQKSGRTTDEIVAELRKLYKHEGPAATIDEMNAAVDAMFAAKSKDDT
ncbi:AbrB/MazE/SpoVT family DNA-binding domain-containing protein [Sphingomonas aliaeris]|uniref:AbrB/MazE/SpoVT family DNA-binding domain-containing protein n=1 Tax=Sphingomonas aliaeris TaxID=2759526 RepID=A0A974S4P6_9SPHN|nr:AbrB/MazE/SpoVT family DNA-binding domain-containing protein [Sphingomonas aliaeris]QQV77833.1 AbrB/MazE/SpoVT family DNA-binding domain-containing protein [Sphingomonas aliaeris]